MVWFLDHLAQKFKVSFDHTYTCPSHGKVGVVCLLDLARSDIICGQSICDAMAGLIKRKCEAIERSAGEITQLRSAAEVVARLSEQHVSFVTV